MKQVGPFTFWAGWTWKNELRYWLDRVGFIFDLGSIYIGIYYHRQMNRLYIMPVPMFGIYLEIY